MPALGEALIFLVIATVGGAVYLALRFALSRFVPRKYAVLGALLATVAIGLAAEGLPILGGLVFFALDLRKLPPVA